MKASFMEAEKDFLDFRKTREWSPEKERLFSCVIGAAIAWGCEIGLSVYRENASRDILRQAAALGKIPPSPSLNCTPSAPPCSNPDRP